MVIYVVIYLIRTEKNVLMCSPFDKMAEIFYVWPIMTLLSAFKVASVFETDFSGFWIANSTITLFTIHWLNPDIFICVCVSVVFFLYLWIWTSVAVYLCVSCPSSQKHAQRALKHGATETTHEERRHTLNLPKKSQLLELNLDHTQQMFPQKKKKETTTRKRFKWF